MNKFTIRFTRIIMVIFTMVLTQGCGAAIGIYHGKEKEIMQHDNHSYYKLDKKVGYTNLVFAKSKLSDIRVPDLENFKLVTYSKQDVLNIWGSPSKKKIINDMEYWYYKRELAWSGVVIGALFKIPILLPSGYRYTIRVFNQNILEKIILEKGEILGVGCGIETSGIHDGCFIWNDDLY